MEAAPFSGPSRHTPGHSGSGAGLVRFNQQSEADARATLQTCLDVPRWVDDVLTGRPYDSAPAVLHRARTAAASFSDEEIETALARHPRIGERAQAGHDAEFSAREQAAVGDADPTVTAAIRAGNAEYENRFDRVFLIRAAGRPATEILSELRRRLNNTPAAERAEVVTQLREIALTRLEKVLA
ncbi:2-oxo-4-hydroxy-4-carboxy-5-ureidoimidazoline decarboxylase [Nakamurella sp. GG22]